MLLVYELKFPMFLNEYFLLGQFQADGNEEAASILLKYILSDYVNNKVLQKLFVPQFIF